MKVLKITSSKFKTMKVESLKNKVNSNPLLKRFFSVVLTLRSGQYAIPEFSLTVAGLVRF